MQGTAATAVAGVYGALRVQGKSNKELAEQRIVLVGAGSAGMGVARMLALGMVKQVRQRSCMRTHSLAYQALGPCTQRTLLAGTGSAGAGQGEAVGSSPCIVSAKACH